MENPLIMMWSTVYVDIYRGVVTTSGCNPYLKIGSLQM